MVNIRTLAERLNSQQYVCHAGYRGCVVLAVLIRLYAVLAWRRRRRIFFMYIPCVGVGPTTTTAVNTARLNIRWFFCPALPHIKEATKKIVPCVRTHTYIYLAYIIYTYVCVEEREPRVEVGARVCFHEIVRCFMSISANRIFCTFCIRVLSTLVQLCNTRRHWFVFLSSRMPWKTSFRCTGLELARCPQELGTYQAITPRSAWYQVPGTRYGISHQELSLKRCIGATNICLNQVFCPKHSTIPHRQFGFRFAYLGLNSFLSGLVRSVNVFSVARRRVLAAAPITDH